MGTGPLLTSKPYSYQVQGWIQLPKVSKAYESGFESSTPHLSFLLCKT